MDMDEEIRIEESKTEETGREKQNGKALAFFLGGFCFCIALITALTFGFGFGRIMTKGDWEYYKGLDEKYGKYAEIIGKQ